MKLNMLKSRGHGPWVLVAVLVFITTFTIIVHFTPLKPQFVANNYPEFFLADRLFVSLSANHDYEDYSFRYLQATPEDYQTMLDNALRDGWRIIAVPEGEKRCILLQWVQGPWERLAVLATDDEGITVAILRAVRCQKPARHHNSAAASGRSLVR